MKKMFLSALLFLMATATASAQTDEVYLVKCKGKGNKVGYCDQNGVNRIEYQYDDGEEFYGGTAVVRKGTLYGLIDGNGKLVMGLDYAQITRLTEKRFVATLANTGGLSGLFDDQGKTLVPAKYRDPRPSQSINDRAAVAFANDEGKYGMFDLNGVQLIPFGFEFLEPGDSFDEMLLEYYTTVGAGKRGGKWGLVNLAGETISDFAYTDFLGFWEDRYAVFLNGQDVRFMPYPEGEETDSADVASRPVFAALSREINLYGMVDFEANQTLPFEFDSITVPRMFWNSYHTFYLLHDKGSVGLASHEGMMIFPAEYREVAVLDKAGDAIRLKKDGKCALANKTGKILTPFQYDAIEADKNGELRYTNGAKKGKLDREGREG
jgi:hypothetical protein